MIRKTRPYTFYAMETAVCSTCLRRVEAKVLLDGERVLLRKWCPHHGFETVLLADDATYWRRARERFLKPPEVPQRFQTPMKWGCPYDCGLCPDHEQHSCLTVVEVTDHCNLYGAVQFDKSCKGEGIHPVFGSGLWWQPEGLEFKDPREALGAWHVIALIENPAGYRNLCHLITRAIFDGMFYKPRVDLELLKKHSEGLILLTSGLLPAAALAIVLNLILPEDLTGESTDEVSGGMSGQGSGSLGGE